MEPPSRPMYPNPQTEVNWCSRATFWWTNKIVALSQKRHLEDSDLYDVAPVDSSVSLSNNLGREWETEVYKSKTGQSHSLRAALFRCYGYNILGTGIVFFAVEGLRIAQAIFLGLIVTYFEPNSSLPWERAYIYASIWIICYILVIGLDNLAFHNSYYYGLKMRVACTSLIYRKLLRLSYHSLQDISSGSIVDLLSTDAHKFDQSCVGINYIWIAPLEVVTVVVLLWMYLDLGAASLLGFAVLLILSPVQFVMGRILTKLRQQVCGLTDQRVSAMGEVVSAIRTIKVNCWEKPFSSLVNNIRTSEWTFIRAMSHIRSVSSALYFISGKLLMFVTFVTYTLLGGQPGASTVFTGLALYEILRTSVSLLLPWGVQHYIEAKAAVDRIQVYLLLEEKGLLNSICQTSGNHLLMKRSPLGENVVVNFEDFSAAWGKGEKQFVLGNINLSAKKGEFVVITGPTGSGKSSLLLAMTGELPRLGGYVSTRGRLGLVTQQPWLFPGSIRQNILYGSEMDRRRYNKVLHACALLQDLDSFDNGDLSSVGEKGVTLTREQRCKISLARAVYQNCDIFLLDDILTQMESNAARSIFTKCICGLLSGKTIALVTQNLQFIRAADTVVVLHEGQISHSGSYENIQNQGKEIEKLIYNYRVPDIRIEDAEEGCSVLTDIQTDIIRQRSGLDSSYGSSESLDQILLEHDLGCSDTDVKDEDKDDGRVRCGLYLRYLQKGGGLCGLLLFCLLGVMAQVTFVLTDWWLYTWITVQNNMTSSSTTSTPPDPRGPNSTSGLFPFSPRSVMPVGSFYTYVGLFAAFLVLAFLRSLLFSGMSNHVAKTLHQSAFRTLMRLPLSALSKYTSGNVLSKFSKDICIIDDFLPASYFDCIQFIFLLTSTCVVTIVTSYWLVFVVLPMVIFVLCARHYFITTAREVKRLESAANIPIHQHLSNTVEGMWILRAFGSEDRFLRYFDVYQDRHTAASHFYLVLQRWFALRLDVISAVSVAFVVLLCVGLKDLIDPGLIGLTLSYALSTMGLFQYSARQSAELEHQMASLDQVSRFTKLPPEGDPVTLRRPDPTWPQYGIVTMESYTVAGEDGCRQLRNMWGCIRAEEKVGIFSRDAGSKSAIVSAILRLVEPQHGIVRIDGVDVSEIGLHDLRSRVSLISQDPVLFAGSLRRNLDPFTRYPDVSVWKALEQVSLKAKVTRLPGKLYADMGQYKDTFSLGERQLMGLARALLVGTKVVILEESASVLDKHSESVIQHILGSKLSHKTVIVIAQRPGTVIAMDRVMVLDEGRIKDFDPPHLLLHNQTGYFHHLISGLMDKEVAMLKKLAKDKFENRPYCAPPQLELNEGNTVIYAGRVAPHFLPTFQSTRLTGVLSHFGGNRFSTNRF